MLTTLKQFWRGKVFLAEDFGVERMGKGEVASEPLPTIKGKRQALPSYLTSAKVSETPIPKTDRRLASTDTTTFRNGTTTSKVLRDFAAASPELSSAVFSYIRIAISSGYVAVAKNLDSSFNPEATSALHQIISRLDVLPDYTLGFNGAGSLLSCSESLAKELMFEGACMAELVLNKARMPSLIQPISISGTQLQPEKDGYLVPVQIIGGVKTILDSPAIFYVSLDQSLIDPYPSSPLEPSIKAIIFAETFIQDLQRVMKKAIHPRVDVSIDYDKFFKAVPEEYKHDTEKLTAYQNTVVSDIQSMINDLGPDEALVHFDFIQLDIINNGNATLSNEYEFISKISASKLAAGAKTMPAVLGMGSGQNVASTESMLFIKAASGIQYKLNEMYSRMFTLAVRLLGHDVTVSFKYDPIDLRPEGEMESFKSVRQSRVLELLSLGMVQDEEACLMLTGKLPPAGYKPLSGTMFKSQKSEEAVDTSSNGGSALNKDLKPASAGVKGKNKSSDPQKSK